MQSTPEVLTALNQCLGQSLIAINQYFLHARILKNWGVEELGEKIYHQSIREMKWSDKLIERILLLEGLPNLQDLGKLLIGEDVEEIISCDHQLEARKHTTLVQAIQQCEEQKDYASRALLVELQEGCEEFIDWLDTQQALIGETGIQNYIQQYMED